MKKRSIKITLISLVILLALIIFLDTLAWHNSHSVKFSSLGEYEFFLVSSNEMAPTIRRGDIVFCKKVENVKANDIISFYRDNSIILHQVKRIEEENGQAIYRTGYGKGLGLDIEELSSEDVIGKYMFKIPWIGNFFLNWDILLLILLLAIASGFLLFIHKKKTLEK